jgi:transglutaminase-like putative cysteine protease
MSTRLTVKHTTIYRYRKPVSFGEHRLMFRPRDSHDMRLISTALDIAPAATVRWLHDVFGNSIAIATFESMATELRLESEIVVENFAPWKTEFPIEPYARNVPFSYQAEEVPDLGRTMERHYPDPDHRVQDWARGFLIGGGQTDTGTLLIAMTQAVKDGFAYETRNDGLQSPAETLARAAGSCRDFALLMMEALRGLGIAARFVSGYLYDPAFDGAESGMVGAGSTHAWVQAYLPGAGWVEFDPTNGLVGGPNLIRVAVARDPSQAVPVQGSYSGAPEDFIEMTVEVTVHAGPGAW